MGSDMVRAPLNGMTPKAQRLSTLCWLTCFEMLFTWKGLDPAEIIPELKAGGIDTDEAFKTGLKLNQNLKAAKALGMGATGLGQSVSAWDLKERLKMSPIWTCGKWTAANNTHIVVVVGASESTVEYYDPWYDVGPWEVSDKKSRGFDWFVHGNGKDVKGTDYATGWYQLIYWKA
mgnify:CR=1 FL=1